jgi:tellurite resistance protein TerC
MAMPWIIFSVVVFSLLALDLGVFHRKSHVISVKEALGWSAFWITLALMFNGYVFYAMGHDAAVKFFTSYVIIKCRQPFCVSANFFFL